jgi:hypothetical protein
VPQREEVIILDSIQSPYYNYNSAVPNSVSSASSVHTPSLIAPSVPSSPPPSFHTHSSPGTPRPIPSNHTGRSSGPSYAELWGVAPSTAGETEMTMGTSNDALATIAGLKQRIEWLEESVGRLLVLFLSPYCIKHSLTGFLSSSRRNKLQKTRNLREITAACSSRMHHQIWRELSLKVRARTAALPSDRRNWMLIASSGRFARS